MGKVMAVIKVMPDSVERDVNKLMDGLKDALPRSAELKGMQVKPIAFGLKAIICAVVVSDTEGGTEPVEEAFRKVPGVESVMVESVDLV
ncbi:translation elongation factor 1B (aEF-1B) [Methanocella conradii HZ254]|uniref:Elongation factor 1-beta n=1 Tax=Methanocella conradii (strain DSM 24694 / JCM 17849 / CGMCC 1.5162 / HZ254) TaxID=1041930 RepID=H8I7K7_METCZ|nr:elongation factor 1-beta [Methanocella conradii]AFD01217.1 translation elongation factor 1B (aEF-1B) [Methanocella conradii HZ254]